MGNDLPTMTIAPLSEECFFRGLLLDWLRGKLSFWPAAMVSSLLFALGHEGILHGCGLIFFHKFAFGMVVSWLVLRSNSLFPGFIVHALNNSIIALIDDLGG